MKTQIIMTTWFDVDAAGNGYVCACVVLIA